MGCKTSKSSNENNKAINSEMLEVKIPDYDNFFKQCSEFLEKAEGLRSGIDDSRENMMSLSNTQVLKDPKLTDAIQIWVWAVSANNGGEIKKSNIDFDEKEAPYLDLNVEHLPEEAKKFYESFKKFLMTAIKGPKSCEELLKQGEELKTQAEELAKGAKDKAKDLGLSMPDTIKAGTNTVKNTKTLVTGVTKLQNVAQACKTCGTDLSETIPKFKNMISHADEVGKKAFAEGKTNMAALMDYHSGEKKTAEEMNGVKANKSH